MVLREFLYVDTDKVRSVLGQIEDGVAEGKTVTSSIQRKIEANLKFLGGERGTGTEDSIQRSLVDSIFPTLEQSLEESGYLTDLSETLRNPSEDDTALLPERCPAGSFVRITSPGILFDARYLAINFAAVAHAVAGYKRSFLPSPAGSSASQRSQPRNQRGRSEKQGPSSEEQLEDLVPDVDFNGVIPGVTSTMLQDLIKVTRSVFQPGLHLIMKSRGNGEFTVTARLQEGQRYLETDRELLFARYGSKPQVWTIVGTIGSYGAAGEGDEPSPETPADENPDSTAEPSLVELDANATDESSSEGFDRTGFVDIASNLMVAFGAAGLADAPPTSGFSVVPFAVYRSIHPRTN